LQFLHQTSASKKKTGGGYAAPGVRV